MDKLLWLIVAALVLLLIGGCVQNGFHNPGPDRGPPSSISPAGVMQKIPLHEMPAGEIAAAFIRHNAGLAGYSAMIHTTGEYRSDEDEYRFFTTRPDRFRAEYIHSAIHGNGTIVAANGTFVWQYHPDTRIASPGLIEDPTNTFFARRDYPAIAARILEQFPAVMNGTEILDGNTNVILEAKADGNTLPYYPEPFSRIRVWIDENSLVMTRMELVGSYNETVLLVRIRNTHDNPHLPDELFDFQPPAGTDISPSVAELFAPVNTSNLYPAKERFGPDLMTPSYLPSGYTFRNCLHYRDRDGRDSLVYSNGTADLVLTQARPGYTASFGSLSRQETAILIGNSTGLFWSEHGLNHVRWDAGKGTYELDGSLSRDELIRIARSLVTSSLINLEPGEIDNPEAVAAIALRDPSARRMVDSGGEILGVHMAIKRGTQSFAGGLFPALLIRYNGLEVDFMVDPVMQKYVGRTVQVPNGAMIDEQGNRTVIKSNGSVLFTFDNMEGTS